MKQRVARTFKGENTARNAWIIVGGLAALAVIAMTIREFPSLQREIRLMRM